jgi:hypothetical protein
VIHALSGASKPMTERFPSVQLPIFEFADLPPIQVTFDAERISSDGGLLLLRQVDDRLGVSAWFANLLPDSRDPSKITHPRLEQVRQRIYQIAQGYPDCNDANILRHDPVLKASCGREPNDKKGLSSQPTLSRFEFECPPRTICQLIERAEDEYVRGLPSDTWLIILDCDATDDQVYGQQQFSFYNGFYDEHMFLQLLLFDGEGQLITALLRPGNVGAARGAGGLLRRVIRKIKARFPNCMILARGDAAYATPELLDSLEQLNRELGDVDYLIGLSKNSALVKLLAPHLQDASERFKQTQQPIQLFTSFSYKTKKSWPLERCIIGKAEHTESGLNPRFVVTSLKEFPPELLYRIGYCGRGQAENYIKDFKNALSGDRLSCHGFFANYFRLLLHQGAYRLMYALRQAAGTVTRSLRGLAQDQPSQDPESLPPPQVPTAADVPAPLSDPIPPVLVQGQPSQDPEPLPPPQVPTAADVPTPVSVRQDPPVLAQGQPSQDPEPLPPPQAPAAGPTPSPGRAPWGPIGSMGLAGVPDLSTVQFDTLRLRLLKVGAQVKQTTRRIQIRFSSSYPLAEVFAAISRLLAPTDVPVLATG